MARKAPSSAIGLPGAGKPDQIAAMLENEILAGVLTYGDRLQSENQLVHRFAVSRGTVRKGLQELSGRGLITTKVGIGSFVTFNGQTIDDALGWSRALADAGVDAEVRTLGIEIIEDEALAAEHGLESPGFVAVDRVRSLRTTKQPIALERSRLPLSPELEDMPLRGLREGSLHRTLRAAGLVPHHGAEWVDLAMVEGHDAELLDCAPGAAFLRTRRLTRTEDDRVIEHVTSLLHPAFFSLHLEF